MRALITVLILVTLPLAGCLEPDAPLIVDSVPAIYDKETVTELPERRFEPTLEFEPNRFEVAQGDDVNFTFHVTDLDDYSLPMTFIDWVIIYDREPNPVAEGDATALPGTWNRTLHAEDYHLFLLRADDGQGFLDRQVVIIQVGEPDEKEAPTDKEIARFIHRGEVIMGAADPLPPEEEPGEEPVDQATQVTFEGTVAYACEGGPGGASEIQDAQPDVGLGCTAGAEECVGWMRGENNLDCWWFPIEDPVVWDQPFTTTGIDPDVLFYDSCAHTSAANDNLYRNPLLAPYQVGSSQSGGIETGIIPVWTGCVVMFEYGGILPEELGDGATGGPLSMTIDLTNTWDGDPWVNRDAEGLCHAEGYTTTPQEVDLIIESVDDIPGTIYVHDRPGNMPARFPGFAVYDDWVNGFLYGDEGEVGGTWVYAESNEIPGLQIGNGGVLVENDPEGILSESEAYVDCANPDTLIF